MTLIDKDEALLPCPFCGGPVGIERGETAHAIVCIAPSTCHDSGLLVGFAPEDKAEAIAAWNTRADLIPAALAVPEVVGWQPIETAPKDGRDMLLWHSQFGIMMGHWDVATGDWWAIYAWPQPMHEHPCEAWFSPFMESDGEVGVDVSWWSPFPDTADLRRDAEHVNGTAETEHDAGNVLTDAPAALAVPEARAQTDAVRDVLAERTRQISDEGWTAEHDDAHDNGELAQAAACYALSSLNWPSTAIWEIWPRGWSARWFKRTNRRRDLVKAVALGIAEIERLDRAYPTLRGEGRG